jgi:hypothetical protein
MAPYQTADGKYSYTQLAPNGETLLSHAVSLNRYLSNIYNWDENRIRAGSWGTDINVSRIGHALKNTNSDSSIIEIAREVHEGWKLCYNYWIASKPWNRICNNRYHLPLHDISSNDKPKRAKQSFDELTFEQQQLCIDVAKYIKHNCAIG